MAGQTKIEKEKQLLVEGKDQQNFLEALLQHLGLHQKDIQIQNFGGVRELRTLLSGFVKMPDFSMVNSIGIIRDAEESEANALRSVRSSLQNANLNAPDRAGTTTGGTPRVSVLILPGSDRPGMLETLVCRSLEEQKVNQCMDDFFECVTHEAKLSVSNPDKARVYAYLATRPEAHHSVGIAAKQGVWNLDHAAFHSIRNFLTAL